MGLADLHHLSYPLCTILGISELVYAGLVKVESEIENYWSVKTVYHCLWAREMISRFRYKALVAFLNVVDPVTEDLNNKLHQQLYQPLQNIAVDECMVKSRNRPGIRQFMKDKPTKWGINLWVATGSSNGYTCDFEIYYL
jgi:hypothetical protein